MLISHLLSISPHFPHDIIMCHVCVHVTFSRIIAILTYLDIPFHFHAYYHFDGRLTLRVLSIHIIYSACLFFFAKLTQLYKFNSLRLLTLLIFYNVLV